MFMSRKSHSTSNPVAIRAICTSLGETGLAHLSGNKESSERAVGPGPYLGGFMPETRSDPKEYHNVPPEAQQKPDLKKRHYRPIGTRWFSVWELRRIWIYNVPFPSSGFHVGEYISTIAAAALFSFL